MWSSRLLSTISCKVVSASLPEPPDLNISQWIEVKRRDYSRTDRCSAARWKKNRQLTVPDPSRKACWQSATAVCNTFFFGDGKKVPIESICRSRPVLPAVIVSIVGPETWCRQSEALLIDLAQHCGNLHRKIAQGAPGETSLTPIIIRD